MAHKHSSRSISIGQGGSKIYFIFCGILSSIYYFHSFKIHSLPQLLRISLKAGVFICLIHTMPPKFQAHGNTQQIFVKQMTAFIAPVILSLCLLST